MERNEYQLIVKLKGGSYQDFEKLYHLYANTLFSFVFSLTKSRNDANDIVQEVFLKVWQQKEDLKTNTSFKSFLFTIAHNLVIDSFRKKLTSVEFNSYMEENLLHISSQSDVENKLSFDDFLKSLDIAKKKLTPRQRLVFELSKERFLNNHEISEKLNISEKTVRNQLSLAINILRSELSHFSPLFIFLFLNSI